MSPTVLPPSSVRGIFPKGGTVTTPSHTSPSHFSGPRIGSSRVAFRDGCRRLRRDLYSRTRASISAISRRCWSLRMEGSSLGNFMGFLVYHVGPARRVVTRRPLYSKVRRVARNGGGNE